jgi:hypothetical protein
MNGDINLGNLILVVCFFVVACQTAIPLIAIYIIIRKYIENKRRVLVEHLHETDSSIRYLGKGRFSKIPLKIILTEIWRDFELFFIQDSIIFFSSWKLLGGHKIYSPPIQLVFETYDGQRLLPRIYIRKIKSILIEDNKMQISYRDPVLSDLTSTLTIKDIVQSSEFDRIMQLMPGQYVEFKE